jgi:hypothetical protein
MTEETRDPCEIIEPEEVDEDTGTTPEPPVDVFVERSPGFPARDPQLTDETPGIVVRDCVMIPQQYYFAAAPTLISQNGIETIQESRTPPRSGLAATQREFNLGSRVKDELVDIFRYRAGKVYDNTKFSREGKLRYIRESDSPSLNPQAHGGAHQFRTTIGETTHLLNHRPDLFKTPVTLAFPYDMYISSQDPEVRRQSSPLEMARRLSSELNDGLIVRIDAPARDLPRFGATIDRIQNAFEDFTFKSPAAFFEKELDKIEIPAPDYASVKVGLPEFIIYPGDGMGNDEIVQIARTSDSPIEVLIATPEMPYPEIRKHSLYRKYAIEYGTVDEEFSVMHLEPVGSSIGEVNDLTCLENDIVQKFPANKVEEITRINSLLNSPDAQHGWYSWAENNLGTYAEISFNMAHKSTIAQEFKSSKTDTILLNLIHKAEPSKPRFFTQILDQKFGWIEESTGVGINDRRVLNYRPNRYDSPIREMITDMPNLTVLENEYPLSFTGAEVYEDDINSFNLMMHFGLASILSRIQEISAGKERTMQKMIAGQPCYSEVVAYRVEKIDASNGTILQNFYFFNDPETYKFNFIDNQVMYGREYKYKIYTVNFVIGARYHYMLQTRAVHEGNVPRDHSLFWDGFGLDGLQQPGAPPAEIYFDAIFARTYSIIEAPYFEQTVLIGDRPPLFPEIQFLPFAEQDDRFMVLLLPRVGNLLQEPFAILPGDQEIIDRMLLAQNSSGFGEEAKIEYKSDSAPTHYQMIVVQSRPTGYESFSEGELFETTFHAPFFNVGIQPNIEYYAIFRAADKAGISNPSEIYKIVLNSYADGIYPTFELYQPEIIRSAYSVTCERLISISPSPGQIAPNFSEVHGFNQDRVPDAFYDSAPQVREITLGPADDENSIWGRKYKVRVSSATSGRSVDLNLDFGFRLFSQTTDDHGNIIFLDVMGDRHLFDGLDPCDAAAAFAEHRRLQNQERSDAQAGLGTTTVTPASAAEPESPRSPDGSSSGLPAGSRAEEDSPEGASSRQDEDENYAANARDEDHDDWRERE